MNTIKPILSLMILFSFSTLVDGTALQKVSGPQNYRRGTINGKSVLMRASHTTKSARLGTFKNGEEVWVIDEYYASNYDEAITRKAINLYFYEGQFAYTLPRGKAVTIINDENGKYRVLFDDPKKGKLYATLNHGDLEFIGGDKWYKVQRFDGKQGWVFSKFIIVY